MNLSQVGAFVTKSITREERPGNPPTRIVETRSGMMNAIGLANVGLKRFLAEKMPLIQQMPLSGDRERGRAQLRRLCRNLLSHERSECDCGGRTQCIVSECLRRFDVWNRSGSFKRI
ncbi:MAG: hypothetical protein KatS3mg104_1845 [Phycisphaerae bacterium]|nr:MAG: hypothetical protein KatS3mg104_1845 [Phycisphaerae bacterium]